jgi:hypothetical protein
MENYSVKITYEGKDYLVKEVKIHPDGLILKAEKMGVTFLFEWDNRYKVMTLLTSI